MGPQVQEPQHVQRCEELPDELPGGHVGAQYAGVLPAAERLLQPGPGDRDRGGQPTHAVAALALTQDHAGEQPRPRRGPHLHQAGREVRQGASGAGLGHRPGVDL